MKTLRILNISGIFHGMFAPKRSLSANLVVENDCLDASSCFWERHLNKDSLNGVIRMLEINIEREQYQIPQYLSLISNKNTFLNCVSNIPTILSGQDITPEQFFSQIEMLEIVCKLYSDFVYAPFSLSPQNGFVLDETSSKEIYDRCLNPRLNPYYSFVEDVVIPVICNECPDVIFLQGRISYYFMAVALLVKHINPHIHICVTRHASEYYSLNKITELLVQNDILFQMIDSIILEYFDEVELKLISALRDHIDLVNVCNLIYRNSDKEIVQTKFAPPSKTDNIRVFYRGNERNDVVDIHFNPYVKCHWQRCTFCGINQKYRHSSIPVSYEEFFNKMKKLQQISQFYDYVWLIDEAIDPTSLRRIAEQILSLKINIVWQARCRADHNLLEDGLPELLAKAGLRELRIGLESASYSILRLMNKFDCDFSLEMMEEIVKVYQKQHIAIHCPMIVGFPQETPAERQKTYEFLSHLCEISPLFTFNLNILNLDVSSRLFREWGKYQLKNIAYTCQPKYFLGNNMAWLSAEEHQTLDHECQIFMREHLYPWMPINALSKPTVVYRLSETSRYTLRWKANGTWKRPSLFSADMELRISDSLSTTRLKDDTYLIYCWDSHHYMQGNDLMLNILDKFCSPCKVSKAIRELEDEDPNIYRPEDVIILLQKFHQFKFLCGAYHFHNITTNDELRSAYNSIYEEENFIYDIEADKCLLNWAHELKPGKALELGVGFGKNINYLRSKGYEITGVDFSDVAIRKMRQKYPYPDCQFHIADIRDFPIKKKNYSLIICSLVLSYLSEEELTLLIHAIIEGLEPGGLVYFLDLSNRDPLATISPSQTTDHRIFFSTDKIKDLFSELEIIELSDVLRKAPRRVGCHGLFGLIHFLGRKPEN